MPFFETPGDIILDISSNDSSLKLKVKDADGHYTIPYIQSSSSLNIRLQESHKQIYLSRGNRRVEPQKKTDHYTFSQLSPGEYKLVIDDRTYSPVGIGTVIAALGDSITEGYHGHWFHKDKLELSAADFPSSSVSGDKRNFPQFSPTAHIFKPEANCQQSWMTDLNDHLTAHFNQPFFIANEGWGGATSAKYLELVKTDENWRERIHKLQPSMWLIHLGVNDERLSMPETDFYDNMNQLIDLLKQDFNAKPEQIFLARTSYDYEANRELLDAYLVKIDELIAQHGLKPGPDFFKAYSNNREKWYGEDQAHPNIAGMEYMAELWAEAIIKATSYHY